MVDVTDPEYHRGKAPKSKGKTYPAEILTPDEVRTLLLACSETSSLGLRNRALLTMLYRTGMRIGEALALYAKDLDLDGGTVAVLRGKGNQRRTVGIDPGATWIIEAWIERRETLGLSDDAPLFCTLRGRTMRSSLVHSFLPRLARRVGIDKRVHPHGFRHTHAYELKRRPEGSALTAPASHDASRKERSPAGHNTLGLVDPTTTPFGRSVVAEPAGGSSPPHRPERIAPELTGGHPGAFLGARRASSLPSRRYRRMIAYTIVEEAVAG